MLINKLRFYDKKRPKLLIIILAVLIIFAAAGGSCMFLSVQKINYQIQQSEKVRLSNLALIKAIEAKKKEPVYIKLPHATRIRAIVEDYKLPSSIWAVVNKTSPISQSYAPQAIQIPNVPTLTTKSSDEQSIRTDTVAPVQNMFAAAEAEGHKLMIGSGYRPASLQSVYFNSLANSIGETAANQSIARPGQSEHQTGLAIDISTLSRQCYLNNCFATTADGLWLADNSYKFGFILSYPEGKENITGYQYEPWHFRYVGVDLATALHQSGLTLDEALPYLNTARDTLVKNRALIVQ